MIQNNFCLDNLPSKWTTQDWPSLLVFYHDYYNSVKPQGIGKKDSPHQPSFDREAHQKRIKLWFENPVKYQKEIEKEQLKCSGKCLYHLSKSHPTENCHVKKEIDKALGIKKQAIPQVVTAPTGQLRHITEEIFKDAEDDVMTAVESPDFGNDTNEVSLLYFARLSKHYLRLVTTNPTVAEGPHHPIPFPVIADSGANYHMFCERSFF
jgi:hypothetical protein